MIALILRIILSLICIALASFGALIQPYGLAIGVACSLLVFGITKIRRNKMSDCDGCAHLIEEKDTGSQYCKHDYDLDELCVDNEYYISKQDLREASRYEDCDYY